MAGSDDRYLLGLDLGQSQDYTALVALQRTPLPPAERAGKRRFRYEVRGLKRWPLRTPYVAIAADLARLVQGPPLAGCTLGVDKTGVGAGVLEIIQAARPNAVLRPILITAGHEITPDGAGWRVAKLELVAAVTALLDSGRAIFGLEQDLGKRGYVKSLSRNVSRAMAKVAADGRWTGGSPPYGYRVGPDGHLVPGPAEEVEAVRELFRLAAQGGLSTWSLARVANERGWPVPAASALRQRGRRNPPEWNANGIGFILRNPVYRGTIRYGRKRHGKYHQATAQGPVERRGPNQPSEPPLYREGCHEPLIDLATFERVQAALTSRRMGNRIGRRRPADFAFSGRMFCDKCGGLMQGRHKGNFHGYVCGTWNSGKDCSRNSLSEDVLLEQIAALLVRELSKPATLVRLRERLEAQRAGCSDTLKLALERGRQHVAELEAKLAAGGRRLLEISPDLVSLVEKELRRLEGELQTARSDLAEVEKESAARLADEPDIEALLSRLTDLPALLRNAEPERRC
jgi:hypothetical protein